MNYRVMAWKTVYDPYPDEVASFPVPEEACKHGVFLELTGKIVEFNIVDERGRVVDFSKTEYDYLRSHIFICLNNNLPL